MAIIAHISDVHLGPLPEPTLRELANKRALGYFNWHRNRARLFSADVLTAITEDIHSAHPDHIAVTGDLVNLGLDAEYDAALAWLQSLGPPTDVTVVPGNHDAYLASSIRRYSKVWLPYATGDQPNPAMAFPFLRKRGQMALIGLSTAVVTGPMMATGRVEEDQAKAFGQMLAAAGREGLCRVVLIHHPPVRRSTRFFRRLIGADLVRHAVARFGAELVLHGHNHHTSVMHIDGLDGKKVPVVGAAAPAIAPNAKHPGGAYNLLKIEGNDGAYAIGMVERGFRDGAIASVSKRRLA
jgi:3',5'-cyclic AMP phosphodiesterase CpdA